MRLKIGDIVQLTCVDARGDERLVQFVDSVTQKRWQTWVPAWHVLDPETGRIGINYKKDWLEVKDDGAPKIR